MLMCCSATKLICSLAKFVQIMEHGSIMADSFHDEASLKAEHSESSKSPQNVRYAISCHHWPVTACVTVLKLSISTLVTFSWLLCALLIVLNPTHTAVYKASINVLKKCCSPSYCPLVLCATQNPFSGQIYSSVRKFQ